MVFTTSLADEMTAQFQRETAPVPKQIVGK
jgi:hypothetical protein